MKKRNLDGIYLRIERDGKWINACLSDMTKEELERALNPERGQWLKGAVIHLVECIQVMADAFGIVGIEEETK